MSVEMTSDKLVDLLLAVRVQVLELVQVANNIQSENEQDLF